jgi:hypothetical protein
MKKFLLAQLVVLFSLYSSAQQDLVIKCTKKVDKKYTPQQVIDSINKKFPNAKAVTYYETTPATIERGWTVTTEDNLEASSDVDYYTVSFKQEGLQYYGLYDRNGQLLECKIQQKLDELPEPVVASLKAIAKDYPGYKVVEKNYFKQQNYSKNKEYYEVTAKNGDKVKKLYYKEDGTLIKMK